MKVALYWSAVVVFATAVPAVAQYTPIAPTPLAQLLAEAQANSPEISA